MPSRFVLERHRSEGIDRPMMHLPHFVPMGEGQQQSTSGGDRPLLDLQGDVPYFLFAGRLVAYKGVQDLVELFRDFPQAELWIAGDGEHRQQLQTAANDCSNIRFLGHLAAPALGEAYAGAVATLVPSHCYESFPLVPLESLAQGTPVIVRDRGGLSEVVEDSGAGFTFRDVQQCRSAMERLLSDPALALRLGRRGEAAVASLWSKERHLERYLGCIDRLVQGRGPGASRERRMQVDPAVEPEAAYHPGSESISART